MGTLKVQYPFANNGPFLINGATDIIDNDNKMMAYFVGNNNIFGKYGSIKLGNAGSTTSRGRALGFSPSFSYPDVKTFRYLIPFKGYGEASLNVFRSNLTDSGNNMLYYDDTISTRDYTTIPFYTYETSSTYMFAFDSLNNFFMITERISIDNPTIKSCALIARKTYGATDENPLGVYEWNDSADFTNATYYANLYTDTSLYNASNIGYCSTYVLFQYVRDGFIYPDIYYCDGGMAVPPDGIVRIGASNFMRLGSNLFLRID